MMPFFSLRNPRTRAQTISTGTCNPVRSRNKSPASAVAVAGAAVLGGMVAILGLSASATAPEILDRLKASSELRPALGMIVPATQPIGGIRKVSAGRAHNSPLADAAPLVMPHADSSSYAGRIEGNLRDSLMRAGVSGEVREQIARIFAARLDVAAPAREGDSYRVLYEADAAAVQRRRVTAVELRSGGQLYQAVWFVAPGHADGDYYSFDGRRLAAQPFTMPLNYVRVSSPFGNRVHPVNGKHHFHSGVDFGAPKGTPVMAAASGIVQFAGFDRGYGKYVVLRHPQGYTTYYAHLSGLAPDLRVGASVAEGQPLGAVGSTGRSTGPHLHFEVRLHNEPTDPLRLTSPADASLLTPTQRIAFEGMAGVTRGHLAALAVDTTTVRTASNAGGGSHTDRAAHSQGSLV